MWNGRNRSLLPSASNAARRGLTGLWWIAASALLAGSVMGCEDGLDSAANGAVSLSPSEFLFPRMVAGQREERRVQLLNAGKGTLKVADLSAQLLGTATDYSLFYYVAAPQGADDTPQRIGIDRGNVVFPRVVDVPAGSALTFIMEFSPSADEAASGNLDFATNDPENPTVRIPIRGDDGGPEINLSPRTIDYGRVGAGDERSEVVRVSNIGSAVLLIESISVGGSPDFSVRVGGEALADNPDLLADPDGDGNPGLNPGAGFEIEAVYAPQVDGPDSGEIVVRSTDPLRPEETVELLANGASPCIRVTPETVEFAAALAGRTSSRPVSVESCGGQPVEITRIYLADGSSPTYAIEDDTPFNLPAFAMGEAPPARNIVINFTPEDTMAYGGTLVIESNDALNPRLEVPIVGRGTLNDCPVAEVGQDNFEVLPLDIVELDGSDSTDPDGPQGLPVRYTWNVVERPAGSTALPVERFQNPRDPANTGLPDDTDTPNALFFVDLAGRYVIDLVVMDELETEAPSDVCPQAPARVVIEARPNEDIHVQLVWDTPGDRDQTDGDGADVDLHLLHPSARARWAQAPLDCYYANGNPDWGPAGPPGNPSLDIDDVNGAGPENINLDEPEDTQALGGTYRVGIDYYRAENFLSGGTWGPSLVTVRIYLGGELAHESERMMQATHHFWEVASIVWTANDRRVTPVNRYYNAVP